MVYSPSKSLWTKEHEIFKKNPDVWMFTKGVIKNSAYVSERFNTVVPGLQELLL